MKTIILLGAIMSLAGCAMDDSVYISSASKPDWNHIDYRIYGDDSDTSSSDSSI